MRSSASAWASASRTLGRSFGVQQAREFEEGSGRARASISVAVSLMAAAKVSPRSSIEFDANAGARLALAWTSVTTL